MSDAPRRLVDGIARDALPLDDRGFQYGDGVFETMLARDGRIALWPWHARRLVDSCARLRIPLGDEASPDDVASPAAVTAVSAPRVDGAERAVPASAPGVDPAIALVASSDVPAGALGRSLVAALSSLLATAPATAVVKLVVTRGDGPRGYAPPIAAVARRIVSAAALAPLDAQAYRDGVTLGLSPIAAATSPATAGLKHLGRLEQVLARAAFEAGWHDALQFDAGGALVGATSANVFARIDGRWRTPPVTTAGVAGACRAALLERARGRAAPALDVAPITRDDLARADAMFLTNAIRGVVPVARCDAHALVVDDDARACARVLAAQGFVPPGAESWLADGDGARA